MKKHGLVLNARAYRAGRTAARWAASGMNWGQPTMGRVQAMGRDVLANARATESLGRALQTAEVWTQTTVTEAITAVQAARGQE